MSESIYHIVERADWQRAIAAGTYRPPSLASESFIHLSSQEQVLATAERFFAGADDLLLLRVDSARVTAEIRYEKADGDVFPHLYGELPVAAVSGIGELERDGAGGFRWPAGFATGERVRFSIETPIGCLNGVSDGDVLVELGFADSADPRGGGGGAARRAIVAYFAGDSAALDDVAVGPSGTPFQRAVWRALRGIPCGSTTSYAELAQALGNRKAVRAVAAANAANPIAIAIPCHRVIGAGGELTGYAWGLDRKRWLLFHEGAIQQQSLL